MTLDPLLIFAAFVVFTLSWGEKFEEPDLVLALVVFSLTFPSKLSLLAKPASLARGILVSWSSVVLILLCTGYATGYLDAFNPMVITSWIVTVPVILYVARRALTLLASRIHAIEGYRDAVIVGFTEPGRKLAYEFASSKALGVNVLGFFDDRAPDRLALFAGMEIKGKLSELPVFVKLNGVETIFIALPMAAQPRILKLLQELGDTTASVYFVPDVFLTDLIQARVDEVNGIPVMAVCETPFFGVNGLVKRIEDIVFATLILLGAAPFMAAIAIGVKLSSPGPVIFRQRRYGLEGKEIIVYKFRTMRVLEDGPEIHQATKNDVRVTRFGAFLRGRSMDELPQLFNVLQGTMSLVGPRPHAIAHNETYRKLIQGYMIRHKVKPGITGLAQVSGCRGETDTVEKMRERIECDLQYLRSWSVRLDLAIMVKTARIVLGRDQNAY